MLAHNTSISSGAKTLFCPPCTPDIQVVLRQACKQNAHRHKIKHCPILYKGEFAKNKSAETEQVKGIHVKFSRSRTNKGLDVWQTSTIQYVKYTSACFKKKYIGSPDSKVL